LLEQAVAKSAIPATIHTRLVIHSPFNENCCALAFPTPV
jgi:hypothetical protein